MATKTKSTKNGTTKKQLAAGLKYSDTVKAAGGVATNPQTGAKTYAKGYEPKGGGSAGDAVVDAGTSQLLGTYDDKGSLGAPNSTVPQGLASKPKTYPVISADQAKKDLLTKQGEFQNILTGMQNQQLANTQLGAAEGIQQQQKQQVEAANKPNQTLQEIKGMVGGAAEKQKAGLEDIQKKSDEAYADYKKSIDQIRRGTFPLTPDQQAMVDYTQRQFDRLEAQQKTANQNYEAGIAQLGIVSGRNRYAPEIQLGLAKQAVDDGLTKIADIEAKAAMTIADLRMGFQDKNYKMINDSYTALTSYLNQKTDIINQMAGIVKEEANFALTIHNTEQAERRQELEDQLAAQEFNLKYNIPKDKPFYAIGGTVYRASDRKPAHNEAEYVAMGGKGDFSDVFALTGDEAIERDLVLNLAKNAPEAGIMPGDSLASATAKYKQAKKEAEYNPDNYNKTPEAQGFSTPPQGGFRTDRHNNPTAMTTDVARSLGLVEGVDYVVGDKFPGNSNLRTARLIGDPIETTIKGLDNAANTGKGAFRTASGKPRWSYIDMSDAQWKAMSPEQKRNTIITMYKNEGGSGQLAGVVTDDTDDTTEQEDIASMKGQLASVKGGDGYVSPEDWKTALSAWQDAGYSAASFKTNFQNFINPADPQDYK